MGCPLTFRGCSRFKDWRAWRVGWQFSFQFGAYLVCESLGPQNSHEQEEVRLDVWVGHVEVVSV